MAWFFRLGAILFAIAIMVLSLQPAGDFVGSPYTDKVQHFLAYGALGALILMGWRELRVWQVVLIATLFGICIEVAQGMTNLGRTPSILDAIANLAGAATVTYLLQLLGHMAKN